MRGGLPHGCPHEQTESHCLLLRMTRRTRRRPFARIAVSAVPVTVHARDNTIVRVEGRESVVNHERLCVKGRYGWDYTHHPQRLTKPLIRRGGIVPQATAVSRSRIQHERQPPQTGGHRRLRRRPARVPRGDLGRSAGTRWRETVRDQTDVPRQRGTGRFRIGQVFQRRSVPVSEADSRRLRHE